MKVTTFLFVLMNVLFVKTVWKIFFIMFVPTVTESFKNAQRENKAKMLLKSPLLTTFIILILLILKSYGSLLPLSLLNDTYLNNHILKTIVNLILSFVFILKISKSHFKNQVGLTTTSFLQFDLLAFPLFYGVLINLLFFEFEGHLEIKYVISLFTYTISVGLIEELSLRGLIQNYLIDYFGQHKKGVIKAIVTMSFLFAALHLLNFDKGLWGELAQFFYAFFIAMAFGSVFYITKRIYPLIIIHSLIDFSSGIEKLGVLKDQSVPESLTNSLFIILLLSPYLFYSFYLLKQFKTQKS